MKLLLTRPLSRSAEFSRMVEEMMPGKFEPIIAPVIEIRSEACSVDLSGIQALLFTSRNAVEIFAARSTDRSVPALCVGRATAQEAQNAGLSAQAAGGDVGSLASLAAASYLQGAGALLHFRGTHTVGELAPSLMDEGIEVDERIIYDQRLLELPAPVKQHFTTGDDLAVPVFSQRSALALATEMQGVTPSEQVRFLAISANAANQLVNLAAQVHVPPSPSAQGMLNILAEY